MRRDYLSGIIPFMKHHNIRLVGPNLIQPHDIEAPYVVLLL